jgi:glutaredoxin 3
MRRTVEVFTAGCSVCNEALEVVRSAVCDSCDLQVHDMRTEPAQAKAGQYGVKHVPAVVVNGHLADCCQQSAVDIATLRRLRVGQQG